MALTKTLQTIWAKEFLSELEDNLVFGELLNTAYEEEIKGKGDVLKIQIPSPNTVEDWDGTDWEWDPVNDDEIELKIDQQKLVKWKIMDLDKIKTAKDLDAGFQKINRYAMFDHVDGSLAKKLAKGAGQQGEVKQLTKANIEAELSKAKKIMDKAKAPQKGRYCVLGADEMELLGLATTERASAEGDKVLNSGLVDQRYGFDLRQSNNIYVPAAGEIANGSPIPRQNVYGHSFGATWARSLVQTGVKELPNNIGYGFYFVFVFGALVARPSIMGTINADSGNNGTMS